MVGITSYGAYIPRLRLDRMAIFNSMGWFAPAIMVVAQGERSMCYWDEDSITMGVAAARDCLTGMDKNKVDCTYFASTTFPYADRQNSGVVATACNLSEEAATADFTGSIKAGADALLAGVNAVKSGERENVLVVAADRREAKGAYFYEMWYGDGAASVALGTENVVAEFLGSFSLSMDFVDHYRASWNRYDYVWEERWARDEGYAKIYPAAIKGLMDKINLKIEDVAKLCYPCFFTAEHKKIAKLLGATPEQVVGNMHAECGETGVAHCMVQLVSALEGAKAGDIIVMAGFGQGCDAMAFKVTEKIADLAPRMGVAGCLAEKKIIDNYSKFQVWRQLVEPEMGIRAEAPTQTAMTALWRKRKMLTGLVGGKCTKCGTPQFPKMDICVNPECNEHHTQEDYEFQNVPASIKSFTADLLSVSVDPPNKYGMVQFEGGGRFMSDFTECEPEELKVGLPMKMVFRRRVVDYKRGFTNYFWKAAPDRVRMAELAKIRFDDRVAIITGAGGGLGRVYALELAKRGCKVVVNDLGGARDGSGGASQTAAQKVVDEITAAGGQAVPNYDNVATPEGGANIVKTALDAYGKVDIVINNAGILRDKSFLKMEPENWKAVLDVHLNGAYNVTKAAFPVMKDNGFGRIIMTTSAAGLYGNFGQTNYSAAKMALVGFMNTLKLEGGKYNIKVNTVAPLAASRLTEDIMPPDVFAKMKPEFVAPMVLYLCSEDCKETGNIYNAGMGYFNRAAFVTNLSLQIGSVEKPPSIEDIADRFEELNDLSGGKEYANLTEAVMDLQTVRPKKTDKPAAAAAAPAAGGGGGADVAPIFDEMPGHFKPDAAAGVNVVFQYNISGPGGGDWIVEIKDQTCTVTKGKHEKPTCTLAMADEDCVAMFTGKLNPMKAYTSGKLKISGDIMKSQLIEKVFERPNA